MLLMNAHFHIEYDNVFRLAKDAFEKLKDLLASKKDIGEVMKEILSDV